MVFISGACMTYRMWVAALLCPASFIAFWTLTPAAASAVLNARRKLWKSTGSDVGVSK